MMLSASFYIIQIILIRCQWHFEPEYSTYLEPQSQLNQPGSLFGHQIYYDKKRDTFYVSAPKAINQHRPQSAEVGAIFRCKNIANQQCTLFIKPDNFNKISPNKRIRALFGTSFANSGQDKLQICASNNPYIVKDSSFCSRYHLDTGRKDASGSFIKSRKDDSAPPDNYGTQIELYDDTDPMNYKFLVCQRKFVYKDASTQASQTPNYLVVASHEGVIKNVGLEDIPGNRILVMPPSSANALVVPYPFSNKMIGSFDVFTNDWKSVQRVVLKVGTVGQEFGYSSIYGKFSKGECYDIVIAAPFYTKEADEGAAYAYRCIDKTPRFDETPMIFHGDNRPFSYFGISIVNLGDINHDGSDDIAVLAPNKKLLVSPEIYIYYSDGKGFFGTYVNKIQLSDIQYGLSAQTDYPYLLSAGFDMNGDNIGDIAVSFAWKNRVRLMTGRPIFKLVIAETTTTTNMNVIKRERWSGDKFPGLFYELTNRFCLGIEPITSYPLTYDLEIVYEISMPVGETSLFFDSNFYKSMMMGTKPVDRMTKKACKTHRLIYEINPFRNAVQFDALIIARAVSVQSDCGSRCYIPQPLSTSIPIYPEHLLCAQIECSPKIEHVVETSRKTFEVGNRNKRDLKITISNRGNVASFASVLTLNTPRNVTVTSVILDGVMQERITINQMINETTDRTIRNYTFVNDLIPNAHFVLTLAIEVIPDPGQKSILFSFTTSEAVFKNSQTHHTEAEFRTIEESEFLHTQATPEELIVLRDKFNNGIINFVTYLLKVKNKFTAAPLTDVYLVVELPMRIDEADIFAIKSVSHPKSLQVDTCSVQLHENCSSNIKVFRALSLAPNSIFTLEIVLTGTKKSAILIDKGVSEIELKVKLMFHCLNHPRNEILQVKTKIGISGETSQLKLILILSISAFASFVILIFVCALAYKFKLLQRIKEWASR